MKYKHPTIVIDEPAQGHFLIRGHQPRPVFIEGEGTLVPPHECYIAPEVPSDILIAILKERDELPAGGTAAQKARIADLEKQLSEKPAKTAPEDIEAAAGLLYEAYCAKVGGKAFNGDPLPSWSEFRADENKKPQSDAWVEVANVAASIGTEEEFA